MLHPPAVVSNYNVVSSTPSARLQQGLARVTDLHKPIYTSTKVFEAGLRRQCSPRQRALLEDQTVGDQDVAEYSCDVVVIGSGIGGLSCAALLARYGLDVIVCESHSILGGAAHAWERQGYHFESGPSLYSGMASTGPAANPLALVLQAIEEPLDLIPYNAWNVVVPEVPGGMCAGVGTSGFDDLVLAARGPRALEEWRTLQSFVQPLTRAATALPPVAFRLDGGVLFSALLRYFKQFVTALPNISRLTGPFSAILDESGVEDPFVRNYVDLLCFLLSGLPANGTITAEVAFMFNEWFRTGARLEYPRGGSQALVDALARGVTKHNGRIKTRAHVDKIMLDSHGNAMGVMLRGGGCIRARKAVVSNASSLDTLKLIPSNHIPGSWKTKVQGTPLNPSFMHLHVGFDAQGLENLGLHHIVVRDWDQGVTASQNVVLISIPSVVDPSLAPNGKHVLHAYYPATEPWSLWEGLDRQSQEYKALKEARAKPLWEAVSRIIPDIEKRVEIKMVGTPLTHARFLRRHHGSYGPAWKAGSATFPFGNTPIPGLYCCGDFTFPGIGERTLFSMN